MSEIIFNGCINLDFSENYRPTCKRQLLAGKEKPSMFWMRPDIGIGAPQMVQFCKLRGRLNSPDACICEEKKMCSDYEEIEHVVNVKESELEN